MNSDCFNVAYCVFRFEKLYATRYQKFNLIQIN